MNTEYKSIFASTTFWGAVVSLIAVAFPAFFAALGVTTDAATQAAIAAHIVSGIGFMVTVYGRLTAKQPVSITGAQPK
jgi:hypothetical protein